MNKSSRILLIEDEAQIRRFVRLALEGEGYNIMESDTMHKALEHIPEAAPALIILDLGLPDGDGIDFIRSVRLQTDIPVLVLSARTSEAEKIHALDNGADDYLTKPFSIGELLARVRALLRRNKADAPNLEAYYRFGEIEVDLAHRQVSRNSEVVHLTPIEHRLLLTMLSNPGKVLTYRHLLRAVWGNAHAESNHYLRIYVSRLRQKLESDTTQPKHFLTETGIGYRFQP